MIAINGHKIDKLAIGGHKVTAMAKGGVKIYGIKEISDAFVYRYNVADGNYIGVARYFTNSMEVDWGQGNGYEPLNLSEGAFETRTYTKGIYTVRIRKTSGDRWLMTSNSTKSGLTRTNSTSDSNRMLDMPPFPLFEKSETDVGDNFFRYFNIYGIQRIASLPAGSFDTSKIKVMGDECFHQGMAGVGTVGWSLEHLPAGSFRFDSLRTVGTHFFNRFLQDNKQITALPAGSFNTDGITSYYGDFMVYFTLSTNMSVAVSATPDPNKVNMKNITSSTARWATDTGSNVPAGQYALFNKE